MISRKSVSSTPSYMFRTLPEVGAFLFVLAGLTTLKRPLSHRFVRPPTRKVVGRYVFCAKVLDFRRLRNCSCIELEKQGGTFIWYYSLRSSGSSRCHDMGCVSGAEQV